MKGVGVDIDELIHQVSSSTKSVEDLTLLIKNILSKENGGNFQRQSIVYKGPGLTTACLLVAACVCSLFALLYAYGTQSRVDSSILNIKMDLIDKTKEHTDVERDLQAWRDLHTKQLATLEAKIK